MLALAPPPSQVKVAPSALYCQKETVDTAAAAAAITIRLVRCISNLREIRPEIPKTLFKKARNLVTRLIEFLYRDGGGADRRQAL